MPSAPRVRHRIALALFLVALLAGCARIAGEPFQPTHNAALAVEPGSSVGQTFQVPSGAVTGVDLLLATYATSPDPQGVLRVALLEAPEGPVLAEAELEGAALEDNAWAGVDFDLPVPVQGSAAIEVSWDGATPIAVRANVPPPDHTPDLLLNDPYPGGELLRAGEPATGDLALRVRGAPGPGEVARSVVGLARGLVGGLLAAPVFALGWSALLVGALVLAVVGLRRRPAAVPELHEGGEDEQRHRDREGAADQP